MADAIYKLIPVLLLLALGVFLGRRRFFSPPAIEDLKRLVVNISLPAGLFLSFSRVTLGARLMLVPVLVFSACLLVFLLAARLRWIAAAETRLFRYLIAGFEAGMLGYAVFGAVYGQENIYKFGLIDLGQVVFVFFVLVPALQRRAGEQVGALQAAGAFLRTPVILAILGGALFSRLGLTALLAHVAIAQAVESALSMLAALTTPLVAFILGAQLAETQFRAAFTAAPARLIALRLAVWIPLALVMVLAVLGSLLHLDHIYRAAVWTMAVLPPPFVVPIYMTGASTDDTNYVLNSLSLATLIFIPAFVLVAFVIPPI